MFVENRHDRNYLYSIIRENKNQVPKPENTHSNIVKLPWTPIIGPKIRKEHSGCKVIFASAAKLKNICNFYEGDTLEKQKNVCLLDQSNTKKIA